jgi:hypothetical protein
VNELFLYCKSLKYCSFNLTSDEGGRSFEKKSWLHYSVLHRILNFMKSRGFEIGRDPRIEQQFKCLTKDHWYGRKGDLEFKAERYPRGFKIEFFQNIVFVNPCGGYYDFDKFEKMPYLIRLSMINTLNHIEKFMNSLGITKTHGKSANDFKLAEDKIKFHYVDSCHHEQKDMNFYLYEVKHNQPDYNCTDRDKKRIENGQVKYYRDRNGRLKRGVVFHNINNMWWVKLNKLDYSNEACFNLFDPTPGDFAKRRAKRNTRSGKTLANERSKDKTKFYYIWSKKHSKGFDFVFWCPSFSGYTSNLDDAGIYTIDEIQKSSYRFETITKENIRKIKSGKENRNDSFLIACDDVQLLGRKVVKIAA